MYNCKYKELSEYEFQEIMDLWLEAEIQLWKREKKTSRVYNFPSSAYKMKDEMNSQIACPLA